ncbi:MAG: hypothetical protein OEV49_07340 [candidate division Zixibacteria bacterium]|nr:hypothetical protein [candidate division Zixibacteria bacterium]MDH3938469.1 hypothetical protein [candidate division Zixibacteria bacterium]MDH4033221.1 hypothetical protein [candidate division Zixibacteria bacterium]
MKHHTYTTAMLTLICLLFVAAASADVPPLINYQGRLLDVGGSPVADGPYQISFKIYGSETGDDSLWWSGFQTVQVQDGLFDYQLGSTNPIPADIFGPTSEPYLGITVDANPEAVPRTQISSVAFAFYANTADTATVAAIAQDITCSDCVTTNEIADGTVLFSDIGQNGASFDQIMKWNGSAWIPADDEIGTGGSGDISAVHAGNGLLGGGETGDVGLDIDSAWVDALVDTSNTRYADSAGLAAVSHSAEEAGHSINADTAGFAHEAAHAANADTAGFSHEAAHAEMSENAGHATHADTAGFAHEAAHATNADTAGYTHEAAHAEMSENAGHALHADTAGFAHEAAHATNADTAGFSHEAVHSEASEYAGHAVHADSAGFAPMATYADTAGYALASPGGGLSLPYSSTITDPGPAFFIANSGTGAGTAIHGLSDENDGVVGWSGVSGKSGVYGYNAAGTGITGRSEGDGNGVYGETGSLDTLHGGVKGINLGVGAGVRGEGFNVGVEGIAQGIGTGVVAAAPFGGIGLSAHADGLAAWGGHISVSDASSIGLVAANADGGVAGSFLGDLQVLDGTSYFEVDTLTNSDSAVLHVEYHGPVPTSLSAVGVRSICIAEDSIGTGGLFRGGQTGVAGYVLDPGPNFMVFGVDGAVRDLGGSGPTGIYFGITGSVMSSGNAVNEAIIADADGASLNVGLYAKAADVNGYGVTNYGVYSFAGGNGPSNLENCYGVYTDVEDCDTAYGFYAYAIADDVSYGAYCEADSAARNYGIYAKAPLGASDWAGYFEGDVGISGTLYGGKSAIRIDHPLDPENRYLQHSTVASPDMMNVYNGNVTVGSTGEAVVTLPDYFEALNTDFRYQLTAIGAPGPNLYIAEEIVGNRFVIGGAMPGSKVSWQVTGVRKDASAIAHRQPTVMDKPEIEVGAYQDPQAFGYGEEAGIGHRLHKQGDAGRERDRKLLDETNRKRSER